MTDQIYDLKSTDPVIAHCLCSARCELRYQGTRQREAVAVFVICTNELCLYRFGEVLDDPADAEKVRKRVVHLHNHLTVKDEARD
jgi:hypothetical protein